MTERTEPQARERDERSQGNRPSFALFVHSLGWFFLGSSSPFLPTRLLTVRSLTTLVTSFRSVPFRTGRVETVRRRFQVENL